MNKQESTQIVRKIIESRSFNREELEALFFMLHNAENTTYYPYYPYYPYWYSNTGTGGLTVTGNTGSGTVGGSVNGLTVNGLTVNDASHTTGMVSASPTGVVSASPVGVPN